MSCHTPPIRFFFFLNQASLKYFWVDYSGPMPHQQPLVCVNRLSVGGYYIYIDLNCFYCQSIMLKFPLAEGSCVILYFD